MDITIPVQVTETDEAPKLEEGQQAQQMAEAAMPVVPSKTFNEAERDQLGGDHRKERSSINKHGQRMPQARRRTSKLDIMKGDFVYLREPNKQMVQSTVPYDDSELSTSLRIDLLMSGYKYMTDEDFDVRPELREMWKPNSAHHLTIAGRETRTHGLMWAPIEVWDALKSEQTRMSDHVSEHLVQQLERAGAGVTGDNRVFGQTKVEEKTEEFSVRVRQ